MSKGQEHLEEALRSITAAVESDGLADGIDERLRSAQEALRQLQGSTFAKSGLAVPFTAACNRGAKAVTAAASNGEPIETTVDAFEKALSNLADKAGGAGGMNIT